MSFSSAEMRSWPLNQISPVTLAWLPLCSPRMAWLVTDLPEPDSPTMPSTLPRSRSKVRPSTALTRPSPVGKCTRRSRTDRNASVRRSSSTVTSSGSAVTRSVLLFCASAVADSRIDHAVQDVHDQVSNDQRDRRNERNAEDDGQVVLADGVDQQLAETVEVEHRLGDHRRADQRAEVDAENGDDRRERGAQS